MARVSEGMQDVKYEISRIRESGMRIMQMVDNTGYPYMKPAKETSSLAENAERYSSALTDVIIISFKY